MTTETIVLIYLAAVNVIGFFISLADVKMHRKNQKTLNVPVSIFAVLGGTLGILIPELIWDRRPQKENMMTRVLVICLFIIDILVVLMIKLNIFTDITFDFISFFKAHIWLLWYLLAINVIAFIFYGADKAKAKKDKRRIPILTLLGLAFIGGSIGSLIGMYAFRHKTNKDYFTVGVPMIIVVQAVLLFFIINIVR